MTGVVYVFEDEASRCCKIGYSGRPLSTRRSELQTGNPNRLTLVRQMPGTKEDETRLHKRFSHLRTDGGGKDWFRNDRELLEALAGVCLACSTKNNVVPGNSRLSRWLCISCEAAGVTFNELNHDCLFAVAATIMPDDCFEDLGDELELSDYGAVWVLTHHERADTLDPVEALAIAGFFPQALERLERGDSVDAGELLRQILDASPREATA